MRQVTGSNHLLNSTTGISIQIYRGGFSVVYPLDSSSENLYFDTLDLSVLEQVVSQIQGQISQVVFSGNDSTLVPLELFESASSWEHLCNAGIACGEATCYSQQVENSSYVVVWSVDTSLASFLETLLDHSVSFEHILALTLRGASPFGADAVVCQHGAVSIVLHYSNGRLMNYLVLENCTSEDLLYYLGRFEQNSSARIESIELQGDFAPELYELLTRYYGVENIKKD